MSIDKLLAGVARDIAHHHFNAAKLRAGADVVGRLHRAASRSRIARVRVDILREEVDPAALRDHDVREALSGLRAALQHRLREREIGPDHVAAAFAILELPLPAAPPARGAAAATPAADGAPAASPYHCRIEIVDARGKTHVASIPD